MQIGPLFLSTARGARAMGLTLAAALIAAAGVPASARTSVRWLFALLLSGSGLAGRVARAARGNVCAVRMPVTELKC
jgi:hypothetical protein